MVLPGASAEEPTDQPPRADDDNYDSSRFSNQASLPINSKLINDVDLPISTHDVARLAESKGIPVNNSPAFLELAMTSLASSTVWQRHLNGRLTREEAETLVLNDLEHTRKGIRRGRIITFTGISAGFFLGGRYVGQYLRPKPDAPRLGPLRVLGRFMLPGVIFMTASTVGTLVATLMPAVWDRDAWMTDPALSNLRQYLEHLPNETRQKTTSEISIQTLQHKSELLRYVRHDIAMNGTMPSAKPPSGHARYGNPQQNMGAGATRGSFDERMDREQRELEPLTLSSQQATEPSQSWNQSSTTPSTSTFTSDDVFDDASPTAGADPEENQPIVGSWDRLRRQAIEKRNRGSGGQTDSWEHVRQENSSDEPANSSDEDNKWK